MTRRLPNPDRRALLASGVLGAFVAIGSIGCANDALSADDVAQRDGLVDNMGWSFVGYAPPVGRAQSRTLRGAAIVDGKARILWSDVVLTQQDQFTEVVLGEFGGAFNELPLAQLFVQTPAIERGRLAMFTGGTPHQVVWTNGVPVGFTLAAGGTETTAVADPGEYVQAVSFDDNGGFAYAYSVASPPSFGVARLDAEGVSFSRTTIPITDVPHTGRLAFDAGGLAYVAATSMAADATGAVTLYVVPPTGAATTLANLSIDPALVQLQAHVFPRAGRIYVALLTADRELTRLYQLENGALAEIALPSLQVVNLTQGDDGVLYMGFLDNRAGMAATVQQLFGHDFVNVGTPGFARYPVEIPAVRAIGSDLYVTVENANELQPGFDLLCHGSSCLAPAPPVTASAAQCVTHSGETLICTEWNHADHPHQQQLLDECLQLSGQFARTRCNTDDLVGGCRSPSADGLIATDWYYGPPTGNDTASVVKFLCSTGGKTFVLPGA
ncbi:hypothetical protein BH11MYX2_BH11MYX2_12550 [soil metagenome]